MKLALLIAGAVCGALATLSARYLLDLLRNA